MGSRPHCWRNSFVPAAIIAAGTATSLWAAEGIEAGGAFGLQPVKELFDVPGPALLGKDFILLAVARRDDDHARETFGLRRFAFDGKEDAAFGDLANNPPFLPRGGRRFGNYFHDLAGKLDPATARSVRNYPHRILQTPDGGWLVAGRVGGDEGKIVSSLLQLKEDGTIDGEFGKGGRAVLPARHRTQGISAAAVIDSKKPRVWLGLPGPRGMAIARIDAKGALDSTFADDGMLFVDSDEADVVWPQRLVDDGSGGAFVVGCAVGRLRNDMVVAHVKSTGGLDDKFGGGKTVGWVRLRGAVCDTLAYPPRTGGRYSAYAFGADAWAARSESNKLVLAIDGRDLGKDAADPIFGVGSLGWKRDLVGLVQLDAEGKVDTGFGSNGVVPLPPPRAYRASLGTMTLAKDGTLWITAVLRTDGGTALGWSRVDAKGNRVAWTKPTVKSVAKVDGDWLVFPLEKSRDLSIRAMSVDAGKATAFGFSAPRENGEVLQWRVWTVRD